MLKPSLQATSALSQATVTSRTSLGSASSRLGVNKPLIDPGKLLNYSSTSNSALGGGGRKTSAGGTTSTFGGGPGGFGGPSSSAVDSDCGLSDSESMSAGGYMSDGDMLHSNGDRFVIWACAYVCNNSGNCKAK